MEYKAVRTEVENISQAEQSDIDWLFCYVLGLKRTALNSKIEIKKNEHKKLKKYAKKLRKGVPLSHIIGSVDFLSATISVNKKVLTPRPETEELADMLVKEIGNQSCSVLDLCTGSGAIAVAVAKNTGATVTATDISRKALKVARKNAKRNNVKVKFIKSNMLKKVWGLFDYIICNPPYIAYGDQRVEKSVQKYEPKIALYAKDNGYHYYKVLAQEIKYYMLKGAKLYLEVGIGMADSVAEMFKDYSHVEIKKDLEGIERFVIVTK